MRYAKPYNHKMKYLAVIIIWASMLMPATARQNEHDNSSPELNQILDRMRFHEEWQASHLIEYQMHRRFYAENARFKQESVLEAKTLFRQPSTFETEVVRTEGSDLIRERVFDKILEAEKEANSKKVKKEVTIAPENYKFTLINKQDCGGRPCYNLRISPRQKSKYSIEGQIWVDAEDGAIIRMQGSPAKKPSFWTLSTQIERRYRRIDGIWLCEAMESTSNIFIAGKSSLKVDYNYLKVQTGGATN
jgi:negative regulator of sigma E activity